MQNYKSYHWVAFIAQPFFTLLYYLKNFRSPAARNIMWFFTVYFAATVAIGVESEGSDINAYMNDLQVMSRINDFNGVFDFYESSGEIDVFRTFSAFFISRLTENGYVYIIFLGIIFGYFYSRNIWMVLNKTTGRFKDYLIPLVFCVFLVIPIWNVGGFRFWTAAHIFLFGLLSYFLYGNKKSLIWVFITPFIFHYAFIVPSGLVAIYLLVGNRLNVYFYLFLISIVVGEVNISQFNTFIEMYAPQEFVDRSSSYRLEDKVESFRAGTGMEHVVWYAKYLKYFLHIPIYSFLIIIFSFYRKEIKQKSMLKMFNFTLLFYSFANLLASLPSGGRYLSIAGFFALSFMIIFLQNDNRKKTILIQATKICFPVLLLFIIVQFRQSLYLTSLFTLIGNPITAIFLLGDNIALNDLLK